VRQRGPDGQKTGTGVVCATFDGPARALCAGLRGSRSAVAMLDESHYLRLAHDVFRKLVDGFESIDIDDADLDVAGDVVTITFATGRKCIVNTQRPVRQIWLAGGQRAWHFSFDEASGRWLCDKGSGDELFATVARIVTEAAGVTPRFAAS
jgi:CyaY protein